MAEIRGFMHGSVMILIRYFILMLVLGGGFLLVYPNSLENPKQIIRNMLLIIKLRYGLFRDLLWLNQKHYRRGIELRRIYLADGVVNYHTTIGLYGLMGCYLLTRIFISIIG